MKTSLHDFFSEYCSDYTVEGLEAFISEFGIQIAENIARNYYREIDAGVENPLVYSLADLVKFNKEWLRAA